MSDDDDTPFSSGGELDRALTRWIEKRRLENGWVHDELRHCNQHNSVTGSRNELSKQFLASGSVRDYVRLRRAHPETLIEISTSWAMDWLLANQETLTKIGIEPELLAGALDADLSYISEISLRLLERLIEREDREAEGASHVQRRGEAISDSLVNYLIAMMLDALDWNNELHIPRDLIILIKHRIRADVSAEDRAMEAKSRRDTAVSIAAQLKSQSGSVSIREVAKIMGVNASTVSRWFPGSTFEEEVETWRAMIESFGLDVKEIRDRASRRKRGDD